MLLDEVEKFMVACDQTVFEDNPSQADLYKKLIEEEYQELISSGHKTEDELDACCDLVWVAYGYILSLGASKEDIISMIEDSCYDDTDVIEFDFIHNSLFNLYTCSFFGSRQIYRCVDLIWYIVKFAYQQDYNFEGAFKEVSRSNMSKIDLVTGKVIKREDGKVLKPESYSHPDLKSFLTR